VNDSDRLKNYLKLDAGMVDGELANHLSNEYLLIGDTRSIIKQAIKKFGLRRKMKPVKKFKQSKRQRKQKIEPFSTKDKRWQALREKVFKTYGKICMECRSTDALHVDHIKPKSRYPELAYRFDNLQVLCKACNQRRSNINCNDWREKYEQEEYELKHLAELNSL